MSSDSPFRQVRFQTGSAAGSCQARGQLRSEPKASKHFTRKSRVCPPLWGLQWDTVAVGRAVPCHIACWAQSRSVSLRGLGGWEIGMQGKSLSLPFTPQGQLAETGQGQTGPERIRRWLAHAASHPGPTAALRWLQEGNAKGYRRTAGDGYFKNTDSGDFFPGGPVAKTPHSQCRGLGLIPGQATGSHTLQLRACMKQLKISHPATEIGDPVCCA